MTLLQVESSMKDLTILHVFPDEKFFDTSSSNYDRLKGVTNLFCLYTPDKDYQFKRIKYTDKVTIINDKQEYLDLFSDKNIDVILFHSIRLAFLDYFNYIDKNKIVIWWSWGGDTYNTIYNDVKPLISWKMYKPITSDYIQKHNCTFSNQRKTLRQLLRPLKHKYKLWKIIRRVDYFIPCIPIDYKLLKEQCKYFRADIFPYPKQTKSLSFVFHTSSKNILIGNSLTYTNNHLDVFDKINDFQLGENQKYVIPISYGWGNAFGNNPETLISLSKLKSERTIWLKDYLDRDKYFEIFGNITHAIFGVLRQQAMGNIYECLAKGIKVYLYKESIVAKQLKDDGYIFFSIEDDLTEESLSQCLGRNEAEHNFHLMENLFSKKDFQNAQDKIDEIKAKH